MKTYPNNVVWSKDDTYITCEPMYCSEFDMTFYMETMYSTREVLGEPEVLGERFIAFEHGENLSYIPTHNKSDLEWLSDGYSWPKAIEFKEVTYRFVIKSPINATIEVKAPNKQIAGEKFAQLVPCWKNYIYTVEVPF